MENLFKLSGKRVLVTGASSGIGRACAIVAAEFGASVVLSGRRIEALEETSRLCGSGSHECVAGDISSPAFVDELVRCAGRIDGLVHAAGVCPLLPVGMVDRDGSELAMRTNYLSFLDLMKAYSRRKFRAEKFSAVAISSVSAVAGWSGGVVYCGTKGALSAAVRALAVELAPKGVRVNAVCPSNIRTPMFAATMADFNDEESERMIVAKQPLGIGSPEQVAWPVCFLLSDASSFITGVNLPVDGGCLAQ